MCLICRDDAVHRLQNTIKEDTRRITGLSLQAADKSEQMKAISHKRSHLTHILSQFKVVVTKYATTHQITFAWETRFYDTIITQHNYSKIDEYIHSNIWHWYEKYKP